MKRIYTATIEFPAEGLTEATEKLNAVDGINIVLGPDETSQEPEDEDDEDHEGADETGTEETI